MEVVAYPNPSEDWVVVQISGLEEPYANVEISNALGQMVYQSKMATLRRTRVVKCIPIPNGKDTGLF